MKNLSLNLKLLIMVAVSVIVVSVATIGISTMAGLGQLSESSERSQSQIAELLAQEHGGNIKFSKVESLDAAFVGYSEDENFHFAYGGAFRLDGGVITQSANEGPLAQLSASLVATTLELSETQSASVGNIHLVSVPTLFGRDMDMIGALVIGWDQTSTVKSAWSSAGQTALIAALIAAIALGLVTWLIKVVVSSPLQRLTETAAEISKNNFDIEVPSSTRGDELGEMARAVEVFRANGLKMSEMTEAEIVATQQREVERTKMMQELQVAFGEVVDAATSGDFSKRVEAKFADEELNTLAGGVNNLVGTVDRGLAETGDVLAALAETNLSKRVLGSYQGAFAKLKEDTNAVGDKLTEIVGRLKDTSGGLKTATGEILAGANDLSERTTQQAATIEQTSATMEQLASTVTQNAAQAEEASRKAAAVTQTAEEGGEVMSQTTNAMERISASSSKISNIIGMIDDIAFQTNLLALNASVEAARAGDAGKGFAVVAVEVRRLAQSAADASSEVKVLIEQSADEVKIGSSLVDDASAKLNSILLSVRENTELMTGIARENREQASSIDEVNTAVRLMDEMTQSNAALVEETNAAIEQTEAQASELDRIVDVFTLDGDVANHARAPHTQRAQRAPEQPADARGLLQKVKSAANAYLSEGSAAIDSEWAEF